MDGWETRRRRTPGHDWCIIRLGLPGVIRSLVVDTAFFRGNYPSHCSVDACADVDADYVERLVWQPLLGQSELLGDAENSFVVERSHRFTHLRLNIFPDGGVARFRVMGEAMPDWPGVLARSAEIDLASIVNGAHIVDVSDRFFSEPANMLMPYPALNTGDGWETKRRRGPGHDSVVIRLATDAAITRVELDTTHFKGNYPESCDIEAAVVEELTGGVSADLTSTVIGHWKPLVRAHPPAARSRARVRVRADAQERRVPRPAEHPSGWRRQPAAHLRRPDRNGRRRAALRFLTVSTIVTSVGCWRITPPHRRGSRRWPPRVRTRRQLRIVGSGEGGRTALDVRTGSKLSAIIPASGSARQSVPSRKRRRRRRANSQQWRTTAAGRSKRSPRRIANMKRVSVTCSSSARREKPPTRSSRCYANA